MGCCGNGKRRDLPHAGRWGKVDLLLAIPAAYPALLVAGAAVPSLDLVAGLAQPVDQREDDPAVVPDGMRVGETFIEIAVRGEAHQVERIAQIELECPFVVPDLF